MNDNVYISDITVVEIKDKGMEAVYAGDRLVLARNKIDFTELLYALGFDVVKKTIEILDSDSVPDHLSNYK